MSSSSSPEGSPAASPRLERADSASSTSSVGSNLSDQLASKNPLITDSVFALEKQKFLARRDVEFDVPDEVWLQERRCLLMVLEARMLLRELVEYKVKLMRMASGNLTIAEIQNLLALYSDADDDSDFNASALFLNSNPFIFTLSCNI